MLSLNLSVAISFAVAFLSALWLHPKVVKTALMKGITDNPDKRKLQREPVPVLGGIVVFFGIVLGTSVISPFCHSHESTLIFALMLLMLYTGTMDDVFGLTPRTRFVIEFCASMAVIAIGGFAINDFHGLWGIWAIPLWAGVPLTVLTIVGIINAINLIDGVNGLSSGYCMVACAIFGGFFAATGDMTMTVLATAGIGALIPFFIHNVFGHRLRMFIGDGGTLTMGMLLALFVLRVLDGDNMLTFPLEREALAEGREFGFVPFTLSVLSIPVFDTLRVMTTRIMHGISPFSPDKTHLHHAFIALGFSHIATTLSIVGLNLLTVAGWYGLYAAGCGTDIQLYFVTVTSLLFTAGVYLAARKIEHSRH